MSKFEGEIGNSISAFENDDGVVEIHKIGNGVFRIFPAAGKVLESYDGCIDQIAQALSWWRKEVKAKIISVAGFDGDEEHPPSLLVVTRNK